MKSMVIGLIAMSVKNGHLAVAEFRKHRIKALVRAENGHEAYLAIIARGGSRSADVRAVARLCSRPCA